MLGRNSEKERTRSREGERLKVRGIMEGGGKRVRDLFFDRNKGWLAKKYKGSGRNYTYRHDILLKASEKYDKG